MKVRIRTEDEKDSWHIHINVVRPVGLERCWCGRVHTPAEQFDCTWEEMRKDGVVQ